LPNEFKIDLAERFPHLPCAPIVEAVVDVRAPATTSWNEQRIVTELAPKLHANYVLEVARGQSTRAIPSERENADELVVGAPGGSGVRAMSADQRQIVQFNRDGYAFSRLSPYQDWERFSSEALRLWAFHAELAQPIEIERVGVRFVNRIALPPQHFDFEDYMQAPPSPPHGLDLPFVGFFHHDSFMVPGNQYAINLFWTTQTPQDAGVDTVALILDVDIQNLEPFNLDPNMLARRLSEMRWLKNKAFFGSVSRKAIESFQ
jgi:uncharacterized protein (TIGR04255 family)